MVQEVWLREELQRVEALIVAKQKRIEEAAEGDRSEMVLAALKEEKHRLVQEKSHVREKLFELMVGALTALMAHDPRVLSPTVAH
jgi:hypothetical protein